MKTADISAMLLAPVRLSATAAIFALGCKGVYRSACRKSVKRDNSLLNLGIDVIRFLVVGSGADLGGTRWRTEVRGAFYTEMSAKPSARDMEF